MLVAAAGVTRKVQVLKKNNLFSSEDLTFSTLWGSMTHQSSSALQREG